MTRDLEVGKEGSLPPGRSKSVYVGDRRIAVFNDGVVQQLSTPDILYEKPENAFVAQFIGENNRFNGTIKNIDEKYCEVELDGGGITKALRINVNNVGERTQLSVRPERVLLKSNEALETNNFTGIVKELIYLGDHIRVRLDVSGNSDFIVKVPNEGSINFKESEKVNLYWQPDDIRALDLK